MKNLAEYITEARSAENARVFSLPVCNWGGICIMEADTHNDPIARNKEQDNLGRVLYVWQEYGNGIKKPRRCVVQYGLNPDKIYCDGEDLDAYVSYQGCKYFLEYFA